MEFAKPTGPRVEQVSNLTQQQVGPHWSLCADRLHASCKVHMMSLLIVVPFLFVLQLTWKIRNPVRFHWIHFRLGKLHLVSFLIMKKLQKVLPVMILQLFEKIHPDIPWDAPDLYIGIWSIGSPLFPINTQYYNNSIQFFLVLTSFKINNCCQHFHTPWGYILFCLFVGTIDRLLSSRGKKSLEAIGLKPYWKDNTKWNPLLC